jgi:thymidylate kinase
VVTVALICADGAGKTSVARALERSGELAVKTIYMGVNREAGTHMLPTTRALRAVQRALGRSHRQGGPPDPARARERATGGLRNLAREAKSAVLVLNQVCEEWYRVALAKRFERRGFVVVFDRHFFVDYWAHDVAPAEGEDRRSLARRVHGRLLERLPRPDCTILLDAPAAVLFARKAEGTLAALERRRQEYLTLARELGNCALIDATRPPQEVLAEVLAILRGLCSKGAVQK